MTNTVKLEIIFQFAIYTISSALGLCDRAETAPEGCKLHVFGITAAANSIPQHLLLCHVFSFRLLLSITSMSTAHFYLVI